MQSAFGPDVSEETKATIEAEKERISTTGSVFEGPIEGQDGEELFPPGIPDYLQTESMNTAFVAGVVGEIPKG